MRATGENEMLSIKASANIIRYNILLESPELAGIHFTGSTGVFQSMWTKVGQNVARYKSYPRLVGETGQLVTAVLRPGNAPPPPSPRPPGGIAPGGARPPIAPSIVRPAWYHSSSVNSGRKWATA